MGRKNRPRPNLRRQIFRHRPSDRQPVKSCRPSPNLIQQHQRSRCGMIENIRRLIHLHHKRRLTRRQIIHRTHTGKNAIAHTQLRIPSRHKTTNLRHQLN